MIEDVPQAAAVLLSGLLAGNELGTLVVVHPALHSLDLPAQVAGEQEITRRYGVAMPALMIATLIAGVVATVAADGTPFALDLAGTLAIGVMIAVTLAGNVPINVRTLAFSPERSAEEWTQMRRRWELLHAVRVPLDVLAFVCFTVAAVSG